MEEALKIKLMAAQPAKKFDVVIICALEKEILAFKNLTDTWGSVTTISGLLCREVQIGHYSSVIVQPTRMGLVSSAITAALALQPTPSSHMSTAV